MVINLIKTARKRHGITQKELARKCNLSQSYLSKLESSNYSNVTLGQIVTISRVLKISPFELSNWLIKRQLNEFAIEWGDMYEGRNISA